MESRRVFGRWIGILKYRIKIFVNRRFNELLLCWKLLKLTIIKYHAFHTIQLILLFAFSKLPTSRRSDFPIQNLNIFKTSNLSTFESRNQKLQIAATRSIEFRSIEIDNRRNFVERSFVEFFRSFKHILLKLHNCENLHKNSIWLKREVSRRVASLLTRYSLKAVRAYLAKDSTERDLISYRSCVVFLPWDPSRLRSPAFLRYRFPRRFSTRWGKTKRSACTDDRYVNVRWG